MKVAIAAIVVASIFNVLALRRSSKTLRLAEQTYGRTEERYQADREDAHNERLRNALLDVVVAVTELNLQAAWYAKLLGDFANGHIEVDALHTQDVARLRPAVTEVFRAAQIALFLCGNVEIKVVMEDIEKHVIAAVGVIQSHEITPVGIERANVALGRHRKAAAEKASELLKIAHRLLDSPSSDDPGPAAGLADNLSASAAPED
ncbi:hypothetical protein I549_5914 [Mycobacterium avium subsp. avium 2285 (R)]|nr:hypothetical protein I549_5914 [Mycobacterium avium subsp. avium 2285 (R)]